MPQFLSGLFQAIKANVFGAVAGLVAALAIGGLIYMSGIAVVHKNNAETAQRQLANIQVNYATCRANTVTLRNAVNEQNAAIEALRADAAARQARAQRAVDEALEAQDRANRVAEDILDFRANPEETQCEAADRLILETVTQ